MEISDVVRTLKVKGRTVRVEGRISQGAGPYPQYLYRLDFTYSGPGQGMQHGSIILSSLSGRKMDRKLRRYIARTYTAEPLL